MLHSTESHSYPCGCRSVGECNHNLGAERDAMESLVNDFTAAVRAKLLSKVSEGYSGWDDPEWTEESMMGSLRHHVMKGDMVDVAAIAAFLWNRRA